MACAIDRFSNSLRADTTYTACCPVSKYAKTANELGISEFFEENKKNTSTVVVLGEKNKTSFKTTHNYDRKAYMRAFDDAIKMNSMMMKN